MEVRSASSPARLREGSGVSAVKQCAPNCGDDGFGVLHYGAIGETKYLKACAFHPGVPCCIAFGCHIVRMPIEFDNQSAFTAQEIGKKWSDRHLAAELCAKLGSGQVAPQQAFRGRCRVPQFTSARSIARSELRHGRNFAHPRPLPQAGGEHSVLALKSPSRLREGSGVGLIPHTHRTCGVARRPSISSLRAQTSASARSGERDGPS